MIGTTKGSVSTMPASASKTQPRSTYMAMMMKTIASGGMSSPWTQVATSLGMCESVRK
jgi:hypothetical protein